MFIKICCISSKEEAELAISFGTSAIGLVSEMPSGPGVISEELISEIAASVPKRIKTFLLTSKLDVGEIVRQHKKCMTNTIQLVDTLETGTLEELKGALPGVSLVQVVHITDEKSIKQAVDLKNKVDAILLDSGNANLRIKILGGTGNTHNWDISREIVKSVKLPVYLAGGLNPENVREAIDVVQPAGVDVCSGVRSKGKLDKSKLRDFITTVR